MVIAMMNLLLTGYLCRFAATHLAPWATADKSCSNQSRVLAKSIKKAMKHEMHLVITFLIDLAV